MTETTETTVTTTTTTAAETTVTETETETDLPESETESTGTTLETHVYTTYSGIKWWEITGNNNPDIPEENEEDDFPDNIIQPETTTEEV